MIYIDNLILRFSSNEAKDGKVLSDKNVHRLFLICLVLAIKMQEDLYRKNSFYAEIGGIPTFEFNVLERSAFKMLSKYLIVNRKRFRMWKKHLNLCEQQFVHDS